MKMRFTAARVLTLALLGCVLVLSLLGCGETESGTIAPEQPATENGVSNETEGEAGAPGEDPARALVETTCSGCHELARVWAADYDRDGWERAVARMQAAGLRVSEDERLTIISYLAGE